MAPDNSPGISEVYISPELKRQTEFCFQLYQTAVSIYPELNKVKMVSASESNNEADYTPIRYPAFCFIDDDDMPVVGIQYEVEGFWQELVQQRPFAVSIFMEKLGLPPDTPFKYPDIIPLFVLGHELRHAAQYLREYLPNKSEPKKHWDHDVENEETCLLVINDPELIPALMTKEKMLSVFQEDQANWEKQGIKSVEDLMRLQELSYRNTPMESYADNFSAQLLTIVLEGHQVEANLPYINN